jgi:hypothetical protein
LDVDVSGFLVFCIADLEEREVENDANKVKAKVYRLKKSCPGDTTSFNSMRTHYALKYSV